MVYVTNVKLRVCDRVPLMTYSVKINTNDMSCYVNSIEDEKFQ